jgi:hypothetical protein
MARWNQNLQKARVGIAQLRAVVSGGAIQRADRPWRGAHVVIAAGPQEAPVPGSIEAFYGSDREVVTDHVLELSWLFENLRDAFDNLIDGCSKIEFYGRLQLAAMRALDSRAELSATELCTAVLGEASAILAELSAGTFDWLAVAPSRAIKADFRASRN